MQNANSYTEPEHVHTGVIPSFKKHEDFMFKSKIERPKPLSKTPGSGAYETNKSTLKKEATKMNNQFGSTVKRGNQWRNPESTPFKAERDDFVPAPGSYAGKATQVFSAKL